jgi:hypothetical protein
MNNTHINWDLYCDLITQLSEKIQKDIAIHQFDQILCLARGGMLVGDALNRIFDIPLAVLFASSYKITQQQHNLIIDNQIAKQNNTLGKRILLVDDLVDSGKTLEGVAKFLQENHPVEYIKTAVIWKKESCAFTPDYHIINTKTDEWIVQPFEKFELLRKK